MFARQQPRNNHPDAGLSLIELLVVVVIVGILAATGVATWGNFLLRQRLNAGNNSIYRAVREAQETAKTRNLSWQVSFREQGDRAQFAVHRADSTEFIPTAVSNNEAYWRELPQGVLIDTTRNNKGKYETSIRKASDSGPWRVLFNYQGCLVYKPSDSCGKTSLRALGRITLYIEGTGKLRRCVVVSTLIGSIREGENHAKADRTGKYCYFKAKS